MQRRRERVRPPPLGPEVIAPLYPPLDWEEEYPVLQEHFTGQQYFLDQAHCGLFKGQPMRLEHEKDT